MSSWTWNFSSKKLVFNWKIVYTVFKSVFKLKWTVNYELKFLSLFVRLIWNQRQSSFFQIQVGRKISWTKSRQMGVLFPRAWRVRPSGMQNTSTIRPITRPLGIWSLCPVAWVFKHLEIVLSHLEWLSFTEHQFKLSLDNLLISHLIPLSIIVTHLR